MSVGSDSSILLSSLFLYASILCAFPLPFGVYRYINRKKYIKVFMEIKNRAGERYISLIKKSIILFKIFLWGTPMFLFFPPAALYIYENVNPVFVLLLMTETVFAVLLFYLEMIWLMDIYSGSGAGNSAGTGKPA